MRKRLPLPSRSCRFRRSDLVEVVCFGSSGNPADTLFTVLYVKEESHTEEIASAWADQPMARSPYTLAASLDPGPVAGPRLSRRAGAAYHPA